MTDADAETPLLVSEDSLTRRHNASTTTTTSSSSAGLGAGSNHLTTPTQMSTKHLTPNNESKMQHQQVYHHRYFAMSRFFQTWILPHWKMKLVRFIFFLYPYLEGYHKGKHPYDGSVYSVTKILSQMFAYSLSRFDIHIPIQM